jgi:hypothetical protein
MCGVGDEVPRGGKCECGEIVEWNTIKQIDSG